MRELGVSPTLVGVVQGLPVRGKRVDSVPLTGQRKPIGAGSTGVVVPVHAYKLVEAVWLVHAVHPDPSTPPFV